MKYGFIGAGNMGSALVKALCQTIDPKEVLVANKTVSKAEALCELTGAMVSSNEEVAAKAKYIVLGVKPQMLMALLDSIKPALKARNDRFILVTMAAGVKMEKITNQLEIDAPVIRIMPNTPVEIGEGVVLTCANNKVTEDELEEFKKDFCRAGLIDSIDEGLIDAGSALSGCGPAFVYMAIEALADGAVKCGLRRDKALAYAASTLAGSAKLMLSKGEHPGALKDAVCSPGGSTIAGVAALEKDGMRAAFIDAVEASYKRTKELG